MNWINLLSGGCHYADAQFAVHQVDRQCAQAYRNAVQQHHLTVWDVIKHVVAYSVQRGWAQTYENEQLIRVIKFVF